MGRLFIIYWAVMTNRHTCEVLEFACPSFLKQFRQEWLKDEIRFRIFLKLNATLPVAPRCMMLWNQSTQSQGYACLFEGDQIMLSDLTSTASAALAEHLAAEKLTVPGIFGPSVTVSDFSKSFSQLTGSKYSAVKKLTHWELSKRIAMPPHNPRIRLARKSELGPLARFYSQMQEETNTQRPFDAQTFVEAKIAVDSLYVYTKSNDMPVCVAFISSLSRDFAVGELGGLYTPPEHRRNGYAFALVEHLTAQILQHKKTVFLSSDSDESAANHLYDRLGYNARFQMTNMRLDQASMPQKS